MRARRREADTAVRGRVVLITGASSGIGAAALKIADAGGNVLLVSRTREKLEEVKAEIEASGGTAFVHPCDLSDTEDIDRMADEVLAEHGHVDILVNNAGKSIRRSVALSYDRFHDYQRTMQLNYFGPVKLMLKLLPKMRERKQGHIVNISSIGVQTNTPRFSAYVASKAALDAFSRSIASEMIDDGVTITTIHMPLVRTPMIAPTKMYRRFPTITPEKAADMIARRSSTSRSGSRPRSGPWASCCTRSTRARWTTSSTPPTSCSRTLPRRAGREAVLSPVPTRTHRASRSRSRI